MKRRRQTARFAVLSILPWLVMLYKNFKAILKRRHVFTIFLEDFLSKYQIVHFAPLHLLRGS